MGAVFIQCQQDDCGQRTITVLICTALALLCTAVLVGSVEQPIEPALWSCAQIVALLYYALSYFPGGTAGVRYISYMLWSAVSSCFSGATRSTFG